MKWEDFTEAQAWEDARMKFPLTWTGFSTSTVNLGKESVASQNDGVAQVSYVMQGKKDHEQVLMTEVLPDTQPYGTGVARPKIHRSNSSFISRARQEIRDLEHKIAAEERHLAQSHETAVERPDLHRSKTYISKAKRESIDLELGEVDEEHSVAHSYGTALEKPKLHRSNTCVSTIKVK